MTNIVKTGIEAAKLYAILHGVPIVPIDKAPPAPAPGAAQQPRAKPCTPYRDDTKRYYWEFIFDPSDSDKLAMVNRQLTNVALPFLINIERPRSTFPLPSTSSDEVGIFYRRPLPYTIKIFESKDKKEELCLLLKNKSDVQATKEVKTFFDSNRSQIPTTKSQQVEMAAGGPVSWLSLDANSFVTSNITATFENGLLLEHTESRPSEVVGASMIPLEIVKETGDAIGSVISNILPIKIEWTNKNAELIAKETELLKAKQDIARELIEINTKFLKAKKENADAQKALLEQ